LSALQEGTFAHEPRWSISGVRGIVLR